MILFKSCPRCGGDVDATYNDDVYCVQCAYRPTVIFPGPRIVERNPEYLRELLNADDAGVGVEGEVMPMGVPIVCPKCGAQKFMTLEKLRSEDNACFRCRSCGHIFSPMLVEKGA